MEETTFVVRDYRVMLLKPEQFELGRVLEALKQLPISKAEITLAARRQHGFAFSRQSEEVATQLSEALNLAGIEAMAIPVADIPSLRKAKRVLRMEVAEDGIYFPGATSIGANGFIPAESIKLISAGLITRGAALEFTEQERLLMQMDCGAEASQSAAQRSLEEFRERSFPLSDYLLRAPEETVNTTRILSEAARKDGRKKVRGLAKRFRDIHNHEEKQRYKSDHPEMIARLLIVSDQGAHVLEAENAIYERHDESEYGHWIRAFQPLVLEASSMVAAIHGAETLPPPINEGERVIAKPFRHEETTVPPETVVFALAFDAGNYLFEDEESFWEHAQWWLMNAPLVD